MDRLAIRLPKSPRTIADRLGVASYAEIEDFFVALRRRQILAGDLNGENPSILESALKAWFMRAGASRKGPVE
jgi:hypothetical protein